MFIIGFFNWPYIGRIIRGQALSLREREFVDAARSLGARRLYLLMTEMLPNLVAPILVYATLLIPTNILFEAALSFLGVGIRPPTATWGGMLSDAVAFYTMPHFLLAPGIAIFVTVLAFNLFGDGCVTRSTPGPDNPLRDVRFRLASEQEGVYSHDEKQTTESDAPRPRRSHWDCRPVAGERTTRRTVIPAPPPPSSTPR